MSVLVQKFGGSSLATVEHIQRVADRIIRTQEESGHKYAIAVVVSAMGDETDELIALANAVQAHPSPREYDQLLACGEQKSMALLSMALESKGYKARSLSAAQAGIYTNNTHGHAKIIDVDAQQIKSYLAQGEIVIVAGFQGMHNSEVMTLGRGGSDLTAVALAAALKAEECQIFTDVDGVYFTDPRIVPHARKLDSVSFDEMIELSNLGAKVLHHRAVLLARKRRVPLRVLSSFDIGAGTQIEQENKQVSKVTGIACQANQAFFELRCLNNKDLVAQLTALLAQFHLSLSSISVSADDKTMELQIILPGVLVNRVEKALHGFLAQHEISLAKQHGLSQISIVGSKIASDSKTSEAFYHILDSHQAEIRHSYSSELAISALVEVKNIKKIVEELFSAFHLTPAELLK